MFYISNTLRKLEATHDQCLFQWKLVKNTKTEMN